MKILIVGSGGREHALAWKARQSPLVDHVYVAPGNAGTEMEGGIENIRIAADDIEGLIYFAKNRDISLTIIGPEDPLVKGIVDQFTLNGLKCFGPNQQASQLEGSKTFAKEFLGRHTIPTAEFKSFTEISPAIDYLGHSNFPIVIKADGLAAGKGVIIAETFEQGKEAIKDMLSGNRFGEAGNRVVIEEFLKGEEASFICLVDGKNILPMASSQDHKAAYNGDTGPNTGGMGAYSPAPLVDEKMHDQIMKKIMRPTVLGLRSEGISYTGFLYAGLMIGSDGIPKVLEFNCRFGDPETQPIMMRLQSDIIALCLAALDGVLDRHTVVWDPRPALGVVLAANGYPNAYSNGQVISGLDLDHGEEAKIFHAGTRIDKGEVITSGGRVLCATALGNDIRRAQKRAYSLTKSVHWDGCWYREDIGHKAINSSLGT